MSQLITSLGRLFQAGIVLEKKEYLNGFFLWDIGINLQLWWLLVDVNVDGKVYRWYEISARLLNIL